MTAIDKLLQEVEHSRVCLIPRPGAEVPSCHEYSKPYLCDCEILRLTKIIEYELEHYVRATDELKQLAHLGSRE